ncbi:MAG: shikimate dehydrogenase family protein [Fluviicola sp.]
MKKYGLIGKSLGHSFSPTFFKAYFEEHGIDAHYDLIELENLEGCRDVITQFNGCNVTIPYKEEIISHLDELSEEAQAIGAVNVIQVDDGKLIGYNSDAFGFHNSIKPFLTNAHERALILGTGGASKAVAYVLKKIGLDVFYISRSPVGENQFWYEDINERMISSCKIIVNTTPVGMYPNTDNLVPMPYEFLSKEHLLVDLIYNPRKTRFLCEGEAKGATILNGETMLKEQALKSFRIWNKDV